MRERPDRPEPAIRECATEHGSGTDVLAVRSRGSKRVPVGGPAQVELRVEAFNLLNRTNFRSPNGNRSANAFGTITSTYDPRQLQLGIKLLW